MRTLVVDTDGGSDDAVALLLAALGRHRLAAVTTVAGNVPLPTATRNMLLTLELAGRGDVPVHPGCDRPLLRPLGTAQHVHGTDGMGDTALAEPAAQPDAEHAVDVLGRLARSRPGELTLVTLGPLTNLAAALVRDRGLLRRFRHVYCMAGSADAVGNVSPTAEYNVWADPEAAGVVAASAEPGHVSWVGWDVSRRDAVLTPAERERLRASPLGEFADRVNRQVGVWAGTVTGLAGYDLPDPVTMAVALEPGVVAGTERAHVRVSLGGRTRGQLVVDRRLTAPPANLTVVRRVHEDRFKALLFDILTATPMEPR